MIFAYELTPKDAWDMSTEEWEKAREALTDNLRLGIRHARVSKQMDASEIAEWISVFWTPEEMRGMSGVLLEMGEDDVAKALAELADEQAEQEEAELEQGIVRW
ncbi:MAG: hypothetical protein IJQ81_05460 [Oscillibacter sp.]|nr:hypothetical protein [Oscillibacter sp.]